MIEPQLVEPRAAGTGERREPRNATPVRLLDTQSRGHIGRRVLHQQPNGELTEDPVWRWSSAPDRYLDTALRLELESRPDLRLVDSGSALTLGVTLLAWHVESAGSARLVGAIELVSMDTDRVVHTRVVRLSEPVSQAFPGDLAVAAGRLLKGLASEGLNSLAPTDDRHVGQGFSPANRRRDRRVSLGSFNRKRDVHQSCRPLNLQRDRRARLEGAHRIPRRLECRDRLVVDAADHVALLERYIGSRRPRRGQRR